MPAVSVLSSPKGLPIATTASPTSTVDSSANESGVELGGGDVDVDHREVGGRIGADERRGDLVAVGEADAEGRSRPRRRARS